MRENTYPLGYDPTGIAKDNLVINEACMLNNEYRNGVRCAVMEKGLFYVDTLVVRDEGTRLLRINKDYKVLFFQGEVTAKEGKPVAAVIAIINKSVENRIFVDAQMVGGEYCKLGHLVTELLGRLENQERGVSYINTRDTPDTYPPVRHKQSIADIKGWEVVRKRTVDIKTLLEKRGRNKLAKDFLYVDGYIQRCHSELDRLNTRLEEHRKNTSNRHRLTAKQLYIEPYVGRVIGVSDNFRRLGSFDHFFTPKTVKQYIEDTAIKEMDEHEANKNNPHDLSLATFNAVTKYDIQYMLSLYHHKGDRVADSEKVEGLGLKEYVQSIQSQGDLSTLEGSPINPTFLGYGERGEDSVLLGDGNWHSFKDIIKKHLAKRPTMRTLGSMGKADGTSTRNAIAKAETLDLSDGSICLFYEDFNQLIDVDDVTARVRGDIPVAIRKVNGKWIRCGNLDTNYWHWIDTDGMRGAAFTRYSLTNPKKAKPFTLEKGTYSVILVGGGGGGSNQYRYGAGGASGRMWKGRITIKGGEYIEPVLGEGTSTGNLTDTSANGHIGTPTILRIDGVEIARAAGGNGGYQNDDDPSIHYGGAGASGGGSVNGNQYLGSGNTYYVGSPGNGGSNGDTGAGDAGNDKLVKVKGGWSEGAGYYTRILQSIDPNVLHGFNLSSLSWGGSSWKQDGNRDQSKNAAFGGGGGGLGDMQLGEPQQWNGVVINCTGTGYGAGGGARQRGVDGLISIIRIGD